MNAYELRAQTPLNPWHPDEFSDNSAVSSNNRTTKPAIEQLKYYPAARFSARTNLLPNVQLLTQVNDVTPQSPTPIALTDVQKVAVCTELAKNWNYYLPVSEVLTDGLAGANTQTPVGGNTYSNNKLWIDNANLYPELPRSLASNWPKIRNRSDSTTQRNTTALPNYPANYYLNYNSAAPPTSVNQYWTDPVPATPQLYIDNRTCDGASQATNRNTPTINNPWLNNKSYLFNRFTITEPAFLTNVSPPATISIRHDPGFWYRKNQEVRDNVTSYYQRAFPDSTPCLSSYKKYKLPSPLAPLHAYKPDANLYDYYLSLLTLHPSGLNNRIRDGVQDLTTKIDLIWENGEGLENGFIIEPDLYMLYDTSLPEQFRKRSQLRYLYYFTGDVATYYRTYYAATPDVNGNPPPPPAGPVFSPDPDPELLNLQALHNLQTVGLVNKYYNGHLGVVRKHIQMPMSQAGLAAAKLPLLNTKFTIYNRDGMNRYGRAEWDVFRTATSTIRRQKYGTPDFYPWRNEWRGGGGAFYGMDRIIESRNEESYKRPDKLFSPWVSPGWNPDENYTMRPAQYLGLLKALNAMGAEFFNAGHFGSDGNQFRDFNTSNSNGTAPCTTRCGVAAALGSTCYDPSSPTSPNGIGSNQFTLGNYIWQMAMPTYAQAIASRYQDVLLGGELLYGDAPLAASTVAQHLDSIYEPYNFIAVTSGCITPGASPDPFVVVRKYAQNHEEKYVIATTLQPKSDVCTPFWNWQPSAVAKENCNLTFDLKDNVGNVIRDVTLNSRMQGSVYMYDVSDAQNVLCYQLDGWHQWQHPQHWDTNFLLEAELYDNATNQYLTTDQNGGTNNDYSAAYTYVSGYPLPNASYEYVFEPKVQPNATNVYSVYVRARDIGGANTQYVSATIGGGLPYQSGQFLKCGSDWAWYKLEDMFFINQTNKCIISLTLPKNVQIDKTYITQDKGPENWPNEIKDGINGLFPTQPCW